MFETYNMDAVRSSCLHLATGRTRDDIEKRIWQRRRRKGRNGREERVTGKSRAVSDEWSRDLKSVQDTETAFMSRSKKIDLIQLAPDLDESPDPSMSKIVLRDLIISSKYYKGGRRKELLAVVTAERLETEQQQKLEQQEQLSIEKLRLEIELSRNANQSATQNNGQTSRVEIFR
ncbi:hypothetical protein TNCV_2825471 [Trichonephila clavipes]|nr:hypothetical protein TNCV_2825471 [Trichonephila clavipes]